ncbi:MAG: ABC transporter ATP-binding protein [Acidilobaceae archaeon]|nr:ABC transporter ATP-binding protein [Acidilobaceae archaeon]MDW7973942.1 ABC transporter ATP-binding protein [Sulfolobales archaeon]
MATAVRAEALGKLYSQGVWGAVDVSFKAEERELVVLLGPNGSGKSTTIHILSTLIKPTKGRGEVAGYDVVKDAEMVRKRIALMPQEGRPDPNWTPLEAVQWYLVARGMSLSSARQEARRWLEELDLWEVRNTPGWELSGGQRRRTLTAMILATEAQVIFLDEPTEAVDVEGKYKIWGAVRRAVKGGRSAIYTTHNMREAEQIADMVVILSEGRSVVSGPPSELVRALPFKYRVVVESTSPIEAKFKVKVGETVIAYFESFSEARSALPSDGRATVEQVSLEDVYLYYTKGAKP